MAGGAAAAVDVPLLLMAALASQAAAAAGAEGCPQAAEEVAFGGSLPPLQVTPTSPGVPLGWTPCVRTWGGPAAGGADRLPWLQHSPKMQLLPHPHLARRHPPQLHLMLTTC